MPKCNELAMAAGVWLAAAMLGCEGQVTDHARRLLEDGANSLQAGKYPDTIRQMDECLQSYTRRPVADRAYYLRGEARYRLGDLPGARADFEHAVDLSRDAAVRGNSLAGLGDLAWDRGDMTVAEGYYRQAIAELEPGKPPVDRVLFRLGCALQRLGLWQDADAQFCRVIFLFPTGPLAAQASARVNAQAWTVRAAVFTTRDKAQPLAGRLAQEKLPVAVVAILVDGQPRFAVQVGRFSSYEEAAAPLASVQKVQSDAQVVVTR